MANIKSAKKRIRQIAKRTERNTARKSRIKTFVKKVEEAISAGNQDDAQTAFRQMTSELQRGAQKGVLKKNTASRKISRMSAKIKAMGAK